MKQELRVDFPKVKHYLYTLQHFASARWVLEYRAAPPVSFSAVIELLPEELRQEAGKLLLQKTTRPDQPRMSHHLPLEAWAAEEGARIQQLLDQMPKDPEKDWEELNRFFLSELDR